MREMIKLIKQLKRDEDGASLIEYTVLLAILLVAVIAIIGAVGGWILNQWSNLNANLPT
jgi:pilus assembly protein Flp/PilA